MNDATVDSINAAAEPDGTEILRARQAIMDLLADGAVLSAEVLVTSLAAAEDLPPPEPDEKVDLDDPGDLADAPRVHWVRWRLAGMWAIAELLARGAIIPCETPAGQPIPNIGGGLTVPWKRRGTSSGVSVSLPRPKLPATHYRRGALPSSDSWYSDTGQFVIDLQDLDLDPRTRRCVDEALEAWRRGLYLATANMLGAAFEGAWMSAATRLRHLNPSVAQALDVDVPKVATVQSRVAGFLKSRRLGFQADALTSHAALLRELRNYGIHPKRATDERLERYLDEATAALLILTTHHHLAELAEAVTTLVADDEEATPTG